MIHYKPLLLSILLAFSVPALSATAAKNKDGKAPAAQQAKNKKDAAKPREKETAKPAAGKKQKTEAAKIQDRPKTKENTKEDRKTADAQKNSTKPGRASAKAETGDSRNAPKNRKEKETADGKTPSKNTKENIKDKNTKERQPAKETAAGRRQAHQGRQESGSGKNAGQTDEHAKNKTVAVQDKNETPQMREAVTAAANDLESKKALKNRAANLLVHVSATLKRTRSDLGSINRRQRDAWDKLQKLNTDLDRLKTETAGMRAQISRFVSGNYKNNQPNAVALFLKKAEPGQKARFLRYTRYINTANEQVIRDLSRQQQELAAQENKINAELTQVKRLQATVQSNLKKQGISQSAEQNESRRQNAKMTKDAQKNVNRKENEQRLNKLLEDLNKRKTEQRRKEAEARKKAAEARLAAAEKARRAKAAEQKTQTAAPPSSGLTQEDLNLQAPSAASYYISSNPDSFSRMQGRLKKPVQGILAGLFGQERGDGGVWKGVFYQAIPSPVSSIAAGTVVYASELSGYGKVVVVDHGEGYVSVYSGMGSISVKDGTHVAADAPLGTSGTLPGGEEGLYLEIRYNGQNMNPLSWIN